MTAAAKITGKQRWRARLPLGVGYLALIALVGGFGSWSALSIISGAIIAPGRIEVERNRQVVQHLQGGVVGEILVQEGDKVTAGQVLLRLDDTALKSELAVVEGQYFELMARRGALEAERDGRDAIEFDPKVIEAAANSAEIQQLLEGQQRLFDARHISMESEINQMQESKVQINAQITGLEAQQTALEKQYELISKELGDQLKLQEKGLAQASRVSSLQREVARLEGLRGEIIASKAETGGKLIETDITILRIKTKSREDAITKTRDLQYREFELSERRLVAKDTLSRVAIKAPLSGSVYSLQVHALQSVIQPAEALMYIVPDDRPLIITSRIDAIHIDQVYVGQAVMLRFSSFDQRTTPEIEGKVVKISADAFVDEATRASFYQAEIQPNKDEYSKLGNVVLLPGMPVEAFIRTQDRTPLAYLVKPMAEYFTKAFRED